MIPVLARLLLWLCLSVSVMGAEKKPHVIVVVNGNITGDNKRTGFDDVFLNDVKMPKGIAWRDSRWDIRLSPGGNATLAALLYGKQPLVSGVMGDKDWRRKPVNAPSLADHFAKANYTTLFSGAWPMGHTLTYAPESRGFNAAVVSPSSSQAFARPYLVDDWAISSRFSNSRTQVKRSLVKLWRVAPPVFMVAHLEWFKESAIMAAEIKTFAENAWKTHRRETYCIIISERVTESKGGWKAHPGRCHYPADAVLYHMGNQEHFTKSGDVFHRSLTDWEMNAALRTLLGRAEPAKPDFRIFHKANWPVNESPDKHRHQGSLVVGKGHALVDGLQLYPATKAMLPDLSKPLDIAKHQKLHSEMLVAHAQWWAKARSALHNPRPFSVGKKDKIPVKLTALDWRPSKTMHADGSSPSPKPFVYQSDLLGVLKELKNDQFRQDYPAHSGSWSVNILRPGRYQITASLLPMDIDAERKKLARLRGGRAFIRLGKNLVQLQIAKGATAVTVKTDANAGVVDLECWFTGQLALERELGAFFVEIHRIGDKKFDFNAKPK